MATAAVFREKSNYHLVLLARNQTGYRNLIQIVTRAHLEGFYYKPRIDKEFLQTHNTGLVALSACLAGEVAQHILAGRREEATKAALWYKETFGISTWRYNAIRFMNWKW